MNVPKDSKEVVVILPYRDNRILMQLRDQKEEIVFPGQWGFFGGSIEHGEVPLQAAKRELDEEIQGISLELSYLCREEIRDLDNLPSYAFYLELTLELEKLIQIEGCDMGLFTTEEIASGQLYSKHLSRLCPVVPTYYIPKMAELLMKRLNRIKAL